ncbi:Rmd8p [Sugiyamaella lignohabitans]|uniref:Rmd8p n=1 Tax=Sugiyamaella lignohabitans TaxID=796027 RepID=A0A167DZD2_9ASCO|nr:Rmd8p [Sugiyamaella lignohabitans]ANB13470.1 Rmd8p [Sugiyamaella lignohabitans]
MSTNKKQPTAKRTPSILVTDVRNAPNGGRPAPFVARSGNAGYSGGFSANGYRNSRMRGDHGPRPQFEDISIDNILSDVGDIPSGHKRSIPKFMGVGTGTGSFRRATSYGATAGSSAASRFASPGSPVAVVAGGPGSIYSDAGGDTAGQPRHGPYPTSSSSVVYNYGSGRRFNSAAGGGGRSNSGTSGRKSGPPPRLSQNIPSRTTKLSQKLVLIPEDEVSNRGFHFEDADNEDLEPPPAPYAHMSGDEFESDRPQRSYAERLPRDRRTDKFPRVTAYCIADGMRLQAISDFLRENHKIRPRIYDEALFAPYYLPLLPGDGEGSRVKSSPGGIMMLEQLIDQSEQVDHHFEYFSGGEGPTGKDNSDRSDELGHGGHPHNNGDDENNDQEQTDTSTPRIDISNANSKSSSSINRLHHLRQENEDFWQENSPDFDPSEPQDFSPRDQSYMPAAISPTTLGPTRLSPSDKKPTTNLDNDLIDLKDHDMRKLPAASNRDDTSNGAYTAATTTTPQGGVENESSVESSKLPSGAKTAGKQEEDLVSSGHHTVSPRPKQRHLPTDDLKHAEIFIFSYGVVVFWNFTENQEKAVLADLMYGKNGTKSLAVRAISDSDIETEEMHFTYSPNTVKPRIYNDMITLRSGDHMIKLAMSHAIAQSTKLSRFEARMDVNMHDVKHVPRMLALTGKLGMKREEVLKISGKLFKLRVDVNLSSNVLDTPEFFWESEPSLNPLYTAIREYLEIEQRILVLNERCKVFLELANIIADSIAEANMSHITWVIIILIILSLGVSSVSIAFEVYSGESNTNNLYSWKLSYVLHYSINDNNPC